MTEKNAGVRNAAFLKLCSPSDDEEFSTAARSSSRDRPPPFGRPREGRPGPAEREEDSEHSGCRRHWASTSEPSQSRDLPKFTFVAPRLEPRPAGGGLGLGGSEATAGARRASPGPARRGRW